MTKELEIAILRLLNVIDSSYSFNSAIPADKAADISSLANQLYTAYVHASGKMTLEETIRTQLPIKMAAFEAWTQKGCPAS